MQLQQPKPQLGQRQPNLQERGSERLVQLDKTSQPPTNRSDPSSQKQSLQPSEQRHEPQTFQPLNNSPHYKIQLCRDSEKILGVGQQRDHHQINHDDNKKQCQAIRPQEQEKMETSKDEHKAQTSVISPVQKQRPNFIALQERSRPELPRAGQKENRALHSKIIQRTVEQHQNSRKVNKNPNTVDLNGERNQVTHIHNGHMPSEQLNQSTNSKNDQPKPMSNTPDSECSTSEKPSKQPTTFFTKLSSKFLSPDTLNSPCDSLCSLDSTPWNMEGTETIVENPSKKTRASHVHNPLEDKTSTFGDRELEHLQDENRQLKAALEEAGRLNAQWRAYHLERQGHVDRLLATIHSLQQRHNSNSPPSAVTKASEVSPAPPPSTPSDTEEVQRLREALSRAQAEHQEHVALLQMQVRAHRDDWEAESAEKTLERTAREQAEARTALLLQEVHHLQQKLSEAEGVWSVCSRCGATPYPGMAASGGQSRKFLPSDHAKSGPSDRSQHLPSAAHGKQVAISQQLKPLGANGQIKDLNGGEFNKIASNSGYIKQTSNNAQKQTQGNTYNKQSATNGLKDVSTYTPAVVVDNHPNQHGEQAVARVKQMEPGDPFSKVSHPSEGPAPAGVPTKPYGGCGYQPTLQDAQLGGPRLASASSIPLKGWIPVSMMHQIAFGGLGESKRLQYPHSYAVQAANNYTNGPNSYYRNYVSPSTSRESSLVSCTSSSENTTAVQSPGLILNCPPQERKSREFGGARPKTGISRPMSLEDDQRKAKHRARNILANAIPVSPVSSGPSTPAGAPPRPYPPTAALTQTQYPLAKPNITNANVENVGVGDFSLDENSLVTNTKEAFFKDANPPDVKDFPSNEKEIHVSSPSVLTQKIADISEFSTESKIISSVNEITDNKIAKSSSNDTMSGNANCNQISASASNETSRSSSPGMSLTTFALTSEGRGIPGAICFSLHPDVKPCINKGVLKSPEPSSPKKELSVSSVHIEPKSPRPLPKSPIEISTKEHWWSVGEKERFEYPEKAEIINNHGTLVNSTYVQLQDSGKKDSHSEIRTARAVSSQELAQNRKHSQEESTKVLGTNTTTFSFTPAVNSSTSSSNISSLESSKACSPPLQPTTHLKSLASKNIASAIISYEIAAKGDHIVYADRLKPSDVVAKTKPKVTAEPDGVSTISCKEIICPSCQMLFARNQHLLFLDHFETCKGPEFADL